MTKRGLGKGLDALFQSYDNFNTLSEENTGEIAELKIMDIDPNMEQPRREFKEDSIDSLTKSIKQYGVVQPILVKPEKGRYTIIAGERRWRAARAAGLNKIPAIIRDIDKKEMLEIALIENLQREDLNPIEEAEGISKLIAEYGLTQEQVSERIGKSRSAVANTIRLLTLSPEIKKYIEENKLTPGHGRALLALEEQDIRLEIAQWIIKKELSVRETEKLIQSMKDKKQTVKAYQEKPTFIIEIENIMEESLGTKVTIQQGKRKGIIEIEYYSNEDLERILEKMADER